jgi:hypothetical protein
MLTPGRQRLLARSTVFVALLTTLPTLPVPRGTTSDLPAPGPAETSVSHAPFEARTATLRIQKAVDDRRYADALRDLAQFASAAPQLYTVNNYDYLRARLLHRTGDLAGARTLYEQVMQRPGGQMFAPYCLKYLAELARQEAQSGNRAASRDEQRWLTELVQRFGIHPGRTQRPPASGRKLRDNGTA